MGQYFKPIQWETFAHRTHRLIMRNQALESKEKLHDDLLDIPRGQGCQDPGPRAWPNCVHFAKQTQSHPEGSSSSRFSISKSFTYVSNCGVQRTANLASPKYCYIGLEEPRSMQSYRSAEGVRLVNSVNRKKNKILGAFCNWLRPR